MADALVEACRMVAEDDGLRLMVLTANGDAFSVDEGAEPTEVPGGKPGAAIAGLAVPVSVALNGDATGSGLDVAPAGGPPLGPVGPGPGDTRAGPKAGDGGGGPWP